MNEQVYTPQEVAKILKLSHMTILRWCRSGTIEARKIGKKWRIPAAVVDKILREGLEEPRKAVKPIVKPAVKPPMSKAERDEWAQVVRDYKRGEKKKPAE